MVLLAPCLATYAYLPITIVDFYISIVHCKTSAIVEDPGATDLTTI